MKNANTLLFALVLLASPACSSRSAPSWYHGPSERKAEMRQAYDIAMANLRDLYPQIAWRPVDFRNLRLELHIQDKVTMRGGLPHIRMADNTWSRGYYVPHVRNRHYAIVKPRGDRDYMTLFVHEWGHIICDATGITGNHHTQFREFFLVRFK